MIGRLMAMRARPGRGDELAATLLKVTDSLHDFPGCELYLISQDAENPDTVHITEVWRDDASAQAALTAPAPPGVPKPQDVLDLLDGPPQRTDLAVLGGVGLTVG
jgi:quinol monooxygenase YgiN